MSKIKQWLPENIDVTSDQEVALPLNDTPDEVDYAMNDLVRAVKTLETNTVFGYEEDLTQLVKRLERVVNHARKPF